MIGVSLEIIPSQVRTRLNIDHLHEGHVRMSVETSHEVSQHTLVRDEIESPHIIHAQHGGYCSVKVCTACATHSRPAFVASAKWN